MWAESSGLIMRLIGLRQDFCLNGFYHPLHRSEANSLPNALAPAEILALIIHILKASGADVQHVYSAAL